MSTKFLSIICRSGAVFISASCFSACVSPSGYGAGTPNMGNYPTVETRDTNIRSESNGSYFYGRRYHVNKTRFWGYLRKPRQPWSEAKLAVMNESVTNQPDRIPEYGPENYRQGFDQNYEYKVSGSYTGRKIYDPNSNLFLPEFKPTRFELIDMQPGWLFSPNDYYNNSYITLVNPSVSQPN